MTMLLDNFTCTRTAQSLGEWLNWRATPKVSMVLNAYEKVRMIVDLPKRAEGTLTRRLFSSAPACQPIG